MHELFTDPFASHVYQAILYTLNGQAAKNLTEAPEEPKTKKRKLQQKEVVVLQTPPFFAILRRRLVDLVKSWDLSRLQSLAFDKYAVPLLQIIIENDIWTKETKEKKSKGRKHDKTLAKVIVFGENESDSFSKVKLMVFRSRRFREPITSGYHRKSNHGNDNQNLVK